MAVTQLLIGLFVFRCEPWKGDGPTQALLPPKADFFMI